MNRLIITCDDAGLSKGINRAITLLNSDNMATTASVVTNFDYLDHAIDTINAKQVAFGVHLNLTDGFPLTTGQMDSRLVNKQGRFNRSLYGLMSLMAWSDAKLRAAIEGELTLQIEKLLAFGIRPGHLTTHMHFHLASSLRQIIMQLGKKYQVMWIRTYQVSRSIIPLNVLQKRGLPIIYDSTELSTLDYVMEISLWMRQPPEKMVQALLRLRGNVELVVHPSEEIDDTYPAYLPNKPPQRYAQAMYLREVMRILRASDHRFQIYDPALASSGN